MLDFQNKAKKLRLGYVQGVIRHHYHGTKKNRRYTERWEILKNHKYSPDDMLYDNNILVPDKLSNIFRNDILNYFKERKEDD